MFLIPKESRNWNFKPKKLFYHRHHLKSEVPPLGFRSTLNFFFESFAYHVLHNRKTDCRIRSRIRETYMSKGKNHEWEKNQVSSIFWKPKYTQLENEAPSTPVKGPAIIYNGLVSLKRDHPLWAIALPLGTLTYGGAFHTDPKDTATRATLQPKIT